MAFHIFNKEEYNRFMRENWVWEENAVEAIQRHPEFRFSSKGKCFAMAVGGEVIGHLMNANGCPDFREQHDCGQLCAVEGAIVVCDDEHDENGGELLVYRDRQELVHAWRELHRISDVAISEHDQERLEALEEYDGSDENEDED
jgi:hypothetical protein